MKPEDIFHGVAKDPFSYASSWKDRTRGRVAGYFCSYVPEEILSAAGMLPFRLFGGKGKSENADLHLQSYSCSFIKSSLGEGLSGKSDILDGIIFPHTCDSIQRLSDIWRMNVKTAFHHDFVLPAKLDTESAKEYTKAIIRKMISDVEDFTGVKIEKESLLNAIRVSNRMKESLKQLYEIRLSDNCTIKSSIISDIFKASMVMDRVEFTDLFLSYVNGLSGNASKPSSLKRIMLSGGFCSMPDLYPVIEESGGRVVWDDLCTGARYFEGMAEESDDPVDSIAERIVKRVVCPAKHSGIRSRGEYIVEKAVKTCSDGVILISLKFCDPHAFDIPYIREMLEKENIPHMVLELEDHFASSLEQIRTRCEAFIEML